MVGFRLGEITTYLLFESWQKNAIYLGIKSSMTLTPSFLSNGNQHRADFIYNCNSLHDNTKSPNDLGTKSATGKIVGNENEKNLTFIFIIKRVV